MIRNFTLIKIDSSKAMSHRVGSTYDRNYWSSSQTGLKIFKNRLWFLESLMKWQDDGFKANPPSCLPLQLITQVSESSFLVSDLTEVKPSIWTEEIHSPSSTFHCYGDPPGELTWYNGSWVMWLSSLNSNWMLVTSASVLSDVHRGGWAVPFPMLTSEKGIFEGVLKAGINLDPRSFFNWKEETELQGKITFLPLISIVQFINLSSLNLEH